MIDAWYQKPAGVETRWATCENPRGEKGRAAMRGQGRKGCPCTGLGAGCSFVMAETEGRSGVLRRIWMAVQDYDKPHCLKGLKFEFFWDGCEKPAVSVPLGDFFLHVPGRLIPVDCAAFTTTEGRSFVCTIPMPFQSGMRVVITNESAHDIANVFYEVDYTLGDPFTEGTLYFHAFYNREHTTKLLEDYTILPLVRGNGRYLGTAMTVRANPDLPGWWGEGEVKAYIDGDDTYPTLCGTGSEDYIGTSWAMGEFSGWYQGCLHCREGMASFYRFHIPDPLYFEKDIRLTIQQLGFMTPELRQTFGERGIQVYKPGGGAFFDLENDIGLYERVGDDFSSIAYFYLSAPCSELPAMESAARRMEGYVE